MLSSITQRPIMAFLSVISFICFWGPALKAQETLNKRLIRVAQPVIWHDPGEIPALNLRYGAGSAGSVPVAPFTFLKEDKSGESPKFEIKDARGVKWVVKLGEESQAETVSSRLVWAAGYFAEEAYYFKRARIRGLPRLSRGREFVQGRGVVRGARFEPRLMGVEDGAVKFDYDTRPTGWGVLTVVYPPYYLGQVKLPGLQAREGFFGLSRK
ncbi:MAG TPA: hypothetical protein VI750_05830 [Pyrinomonadaceae bacterium]|nr:hypothetical protein [Pyrinomonadaceae bacterium]